jgi:hypothetical protein
MKAKQHSAKDCINAMKKARYSLNQISAACEEFGFLPVSTGWLSEVGNGHKQANEGLTKALSKACKGLRVKV